MKIPAPLAIRRGAPAWEARAATQGRPYGCVPVRTSEAGMEFRL